MKKEIIFISHDASRTGAPILLLNFLRWFKQNTDIPFRIILRKGGELESEFIELAPTLVFEQELNNGIYDRIKRRFIRHDPSLRLKKWLDGFNVGLIYSNTSTNGNLLELLSFLDCPVISHIHELEYWLYRSGTDWEKTKCFTNYYIAASQAVKDNLLEKHNIPDIYVKVVHGFVNAIKASGVIISSVEIEDQIRKKLQIPHDAFIVGGSGTTDWRKAPDVFVSLAKYIHRIPLDRPVHFVWVGGASSGDIRHFELQYDIDKLGISPYVRFVGSVSNPWEYFTLFDVFTLTSREDPYPLVCLEAASLAKPIICFDQAGGEPEFIEDDCGFVVPYLDIEAMADKILLLIKSPDLRNKMGIQAKHKVVSRHDISVAAPQIIEIIRHVQERESML
jgi:glycosyltransferase involved in cell wall biosynthesis